MLTPSGCLQGLEESVREREAGRSIGSSSQILHFRSVYPMGVSSHVWVVGAPLRSAVKPEAPGVQLGWTWVLELLCPHSQGEVETAPEQVRATTAAMTAGPQKEAGAAGQDLARSLGNGWGLASPGRCVYWDQNTNLEKHCLDSEIAQDPDDLGSQMSYDGNFGKHWLKKKRM